MATLWLQLAVRNFPILRKTNEAILGLLVLPSPPFYSFLFYNIIGRVYIMFWSCSVIKT